MHMLLLFCSALKGSFYWYYQCECVCVCVYLWIRVGGWGSKVTCVQFAHSYIHKSPQTDCIAIAIPILNTRCRYTTALTMQNGCLLNE